MFRFVHLPTAPFLEAQLAGFWTDEETARFDSELGPNLLRFRARHAALRMLVDAREFVVQADYVVQTARGFEKLLLAKAGDRVAFVVASPLLRLQISRVHEDPRISVFTSREDAKLWLAG